MQWKVNSRETIFDLKGNDLGICIHKIVGLDSWFLSCHRLNVKDLDLKLGRLAILLALADG